MPSPEEAARHPLGGADVPETGDGKQRSRFPHDARRQPLQRIR